MITIKERSNRCKKKFLFIIKYAMFNWRLIKVANDKAIMLFTFQLMSVMYLRNDDVPIAKKE
ncbi:hypothetical protein IW01_01735 [Pectobacterium brasiliense]|nr:hypothetical protein IW01_01735 [Pectobacterium brasiliense]